MSKLHILTRLCSLQSRSSLLFCFRSASRTFASSRFFPSHGREPPSLSSADGFSRSPGRSLFFLSAAIPPTTRHPSATVTHSATLSLCLSFCLSFSLSPIIELLFSSYVSRPVLRAHRNVQFRAVRIRVRFSRHVSAAHRHRNRGRFLLPLTARSLILLRSAPRRFRERAHRLCWSAICIRNSASYVYSVNR